MVENYDIMAIEFFIGARAETELQQRYKGVSDGMEDDNVLAFF